MKFRTLKRSDRGPEVADVQRRLIKLGYDVGKFAPDQIYGPRTARAVKDFRSVQGLPEGDTVDETVWKLLVERTYDLGGRLLYLKSPNFRGRDVHDLQVKLNQLGFHAGEIDGIFGPNTHHALREFQREFGIAEDGIFGPECLRSFTYLRKVFAENTSVEFADRDRSGSVVQALDGRSIFLDIDKLDPDAPLDTEILHAFLYDWGLRLGNLLEIMNSLVAYGPGFDFERMIFHDDLDFELAKRGSETDSEIRLLLGVTSESSGVIEVRRCPGTSLIQSPEQAHEKAEKARILAKNLVTHLQGKLDLNLKIIEPQELEMSIVAGKPVVSSEVEEPPAAAYPTEKRPAEPVCLALRAIHYGYNINALREADEETRQKIAVASFDAIKDLYLARSFT